MNNELRGNGLQLKSRDSSFGIPDSRKSEGFSLLESLIALSVGAAILVLVLAIGVRANRAFRTAVAQRDAITMTERALDLFTRDARAAQTGLDGGYPIRVAEDRTLVILSDVDGDAAAEWVRYTLVRPDAADGGTLERSVAEAGGVPPHYDEATATTTTVARGIRNGERPIFTYYTANYPKDTASNPLPTPSRLSETRYVEIGLDVNVDPKAAPTTTITSGVAIRNLREGL